MGVAGDPERAEINQRLLGPWSSQFPRGDEATQDMSDLEIDEVRGDDRLACRQDPGEEPRLLRRPQDQFESG
jgi:hypothetical protein